MSSSLVSHRVWLGLGGNIGSVRDAMITTISRLSRGGLSITQVSSLYETPPWGLEDQPRFLNCCLEASTTLSPSNLLILCQDIEREGGRERKIRWGPRTIDIDILFYEGCEQSDTNLSLPHPRISERAFVLVPLSEISPNLELSGNVISSLSSSIDKQGMEILSTSPDWWKSGD